MTRIRRPHRRANTEDAGFTLIEVLVSLLVLSVGIVPAFAVFPRSHANAATAQNLQIASQLGTDSIEQLRGTPWATLTAGALRHSVSFPAGAPVADRVTFTGGLPSAYRPEGKPPEPLVPFAAAASTQPLDYEELAVDGRRFGVYRFASWRKESCPLISVSQLLGGVDITATLNTITGLQSKITSVNTLLASTTTNLTARTSAVNTLLGTGSTSLTALTNTANSALASANGIAGSLLTFVTTTLNTATKTSIGTTLTNISTIRTTLQAQQSTLSTISGQLSAASTQLGTLGTSLSTLATKLTNLQSAITTATASGIISGNLIDLCQLPDDLDLPNLDDLGSLTGKLTEAGTTLDGLGLNGSNTLTALSTNLTTLGGSLSTLATSRTTTSDKFATLTGSVANANAVSNLLCGVLDLLGLCPPVRNAENGVTSNSVLTYSGMISVPAALASASTTLSDDSAVFSASGLIGTAASSTTSGTGLTGVIGVLLGSPPVGNTIRISVAVIPLGLPSGVGPTKPVWITGVITNPSARLL